MRNKPSPILERGVTVAAGPILTFSIYLLFAGHNQPGGGFAGGLVAGVLIALVAATGGVDAVRRVLPVRSTALIGTGLTLAATTGFASLSASGGFLASGYRELDVPVIGSVKIVSSLAFDIGVYLTVVGMSLLLIRALGTPTDIEETA